MAARSAEGPTNVTQSERDGGATIGQVLAQNGVRALFTLCGGHISPILRGAKQHGIPVVDVRDEKHAVFAADAVARLTGTVGVAAVTAGPGVTNTITAVKNAQMGESPVLVLGGATATVLKGRGSLQDIDQQVLMKPITKWSTVVKTVRSIGPTIEKAIKIAREGVPGPVFVELPVDVLYAEEIVSGWYMKEAGVENATSLGGKALGLYLKGHLYRQFNQPHIQLDLPTPELPSLRDRDSQVQKAADLLAHAEKPVLVVGSQALVGYTEAQAKSLAAAVRTLGVPTFLGGMARGLLGRHSEIQFRHKRSKALRTADVVVICGFPFDFRMGYGRSISSKAKIISANLDARALRKNRRPEMPLQMHPGAFLHELAASAGSTGTRDAWFAELREREAARDAEVLEQSKATGELINPLDFFVKLEEKLDDDALLVVDGGDFVATAAYILRPRAPLRWLDPGVFGTLGVGGGFAVGAKVVHRDAELWLIYGDGSSAYSLSEFDTCVRHGLAPIAVVGTDASWAQIAREQVEILEDDVGTVLLRTPYHTVAEGYGGVGLLLDDPRKIDETLDEAKAIAREGKPVLINVQLRRSDFRKGSISI
ncbi:MAG: thiamine pyrophosphate-binding protein [Myxococcales bacterium]|nr:thiamine pyrophosphate-binding protein [Myxococcales bacterium]